MADWERARPVAELCKRTSFSNLRSLLPFDAWIGIVVIGLTLACLVDRRKIVWTTDVINACAIALAVLLAITVIWLLAILEIAPLVHTRYLVGCYPLILLASGVLLGQLRDWKWIVVLAAAMSICWTLSQVALLGYDTVDRSLGNDLKIGKGQCEPLIKLRKVIQVSC